MTGVSFISGPSAATRALAFHQSSVATSLERLATGKKVNRASDDPSGIVAINQFKGRITEINKLLERFDFEEARLGATEGGLSVIQDLVLELKGLNITGANSGGLSDEEKEGIRVEAQSVIDAIGFTTTNTFFNGFQVLAGQAPDLGGLIEAIDQDPEKAQEIIDAAVNEVSGRRGAIGARLKGIDSDRNVLLAELEGNTGALSSIEDTDYAKEAAALVRSQILEQATIKAILVEREQAGRVLDLIANVPSGGRRAGI